MAEHLQQKKQPELSPFNQMGKPISFRARAVAYEHCKDIGLNQARLVECINAVSEQLQRDKPYEAQAAGMKFLDLTGVYRLFAVLLTEAAKEEASMTHTKLTRMALSHHPRYTALNMPVRCPDTPEATKRPESITVRVFRALLRQCRKARLIQERAALWKSFQRVAAEIGVRPDCQQQTAEQRAKLDRIRQIEQQLRELRNTTQTNK